jgi:hypothetical protein
MTAAANYGARKELLSGFRVRISRWFDGKYEPEGQSVLRSAINRDTRAAEAAVRQAGCFGVVKLAKPSHNESRVQEELSADIAAYRTRWRHIVFVIYDLGVIADPDRLRRENMRLFGVNVLIVKH